MELSIGYSTCPNDTFIFDALVNRKIPSSGIQYKPFLADVEELNRMASQEKLAISKLSYHAIGHFRKYYQVLDAGSALGYGNGPLLVSKKQFSINEISSLRIGIPGQYTTANLLLGLAFPEAANKTEMLFSDISQALFSDEIDVGVLIHETRFTYAASGLNLILDLGAFWEQKTSMPIPLGGIAIKRDMNQSVKVQVQKDIKASIAYAFKNPESSMDYMIQHAQELDEDILKLHVKTFVNDFSLSLGIKGRKAVGKLMEWGEASGLFVQLDDDIFV